MTLRERILIVLLGMLCCYGGLEILVFKRLIAPEFEKQERQQAQETLLHCTNALETQLNDLQKKLSLLAKSGQLCPLPPSSPGAFPESVMESLGLDFAIFYDSGWNPIYQTGTLSLEKANELFLGPDNAFINKKVAGYSNKAPIYDQPFPLFAVAVPVTRSPTSQTVEGTLVGGLFLTPNRLESLRKHLHLRFNWDFLSPDQQTGQTRQIVNRIAPESPYDFVPLGKQLLQASTVLYDCRKQPVLLIKTFHDRSISRQGMAIMYAAVYIKLTAGAVAVLLLTALLQNVIVKPINKLSQHIVHVGHTGNGKNALAMSRKDEIGVLASEFNEMCRRLQNAQVKLMEKSYLSGVTEMSSGILHNVRNALSPITTRLERIKGQVRQIPLANLEQARQELQHSGLDSQRRQDLMRFVDLTFQNVLMNLKDMVIGLDDLSEQVMQIEDMLHLQRTFGRDDRPVEFVEPHTLLEKAMETVPAQFRNDCRIVIHSRIKKLAAIPVEPTTFLQVLQNLLINAGESLENEKPLYRKIHIFADAETHEGKNMLHWQIRDNGVGIDPDNLRQIFERGASSKRKGLTGIGLHWCANAITAMRGRIWAESPGRHHGATFHILIPASAEEIPVRTGKEA
ncbi:MAG: ATP-binding protein [Planctomycetales bacterium]|nr:ATP-binding protein [Planctomycetales bacterium]